MYDALREAFREAARREFASVPPEEELHHVFSERFQRRMRRLIRAEANGYLYLINTAAKRAAIVAAIILMLLGTAMAIKPIRERVIQFFVDVYEEYFEIRFGHEEKDDLDPTPKPMVRYTLTELPEGYEETEYIEWDHLLWTHWRNDEGRSISLKQETGTQEITVNGMGQPQSTFQIDGQLVAIYQYDSAVTYIWERDEALFSLSVHVSISKEDATRMIESLEIIE